LEKKDGWNRHFSRVKVATYSIFSHLCALNRETRTFGNYFQDFLETLSEKERRKLDYLLSLLITEERLSTKIVKVVRDGIFELRMLYSGNIYRVFFIFDENAVVILFSGFQKKTPKTPKSEIEKALKIKKEYDGHKERNKKL